MKDAKYIASSQLLVFRPEGKLDVQKLKKYYEEVARLGRNKCIRRFIDFEALDDIAFGFEDMMAIEAIRQGANIGYTQTVKIVFHASNNWAQGVANMVMTLMEKENYRMIMTRDTKEAAAFLDVEEDLIRGPSA